MNEGNQGGEGGTGGAAATGAGAPGAGTGGAPPGAGAAGGAAPARAALPARSTAGIPEASLKQRLDRQAETARRSLLAEMGVTDPAEVKKQLARLAELEAKDTEAKRAQMSELEQARTDLEAERARAADLQAQLENVHTERSYEKQDALILGIASRYVSPKAAPLARFQFGAYVKTLTPKEQEAMTDRDAQKWFQVYARENPEFALTPEGAAQAQAAAAAAAKKAPAVRVIANGLPPRRVTPPGGAPSRAGAKAPSLERGELPNGKTVRPGPNQASKEEIRALYRQSGINYPG